MKLEFVAGAVRKLAKLSCGIITITVQSWVNYLHNLQIDILDENRPYFIYNSCKLYLYNISSENTPGKVPYRFN